MILYSSRRARLRIFSGSLADAQCPSPIRQREMCLVSCSPSTLSGCAVTFWIYLPIFLLPTQRTNTHAPSEIFFSSSSLPLYLSRSLVPYLRSIDRALDSNCTYLIFVAVVSTVLHLSATELHHVDRLDAGIGEHFRAEMRTPKFLDVPITVNHLRFICCFVCFINEYVGSCSFIRAKAPTLSE